MTADKGSLEDIRQQLDELRKRAAERGLDLKSEVGDLERRLEDAHRDEMETLSRYDRVHLARHQERPFTLDFVDYLCSDWIELHGDRKYRDDPAIVGGWATLEGRTVMIVGQQKGRDMKENLRRNFGSPHPEGYRKAERLFRLAEKFGRSVVTFVDTQGAYPGIGAEERGQAEAIARNLIVMAGLRVPIVTTIIGEGGSGGALGIAVADRVLMMENAIYSVISPEGCAAILWRSRDRAEDAADALKLTASDLADSGVIDEVISEPPGGAHLDPEAAARTVGEAIVRHLDQLEGRDPEDLVRERREKYYAMGHWEERADA
ncbi:MAG: acetyl-CoA carboxylase carboxyltransferase subunit alpha [marine benthic group bacterium]|jgi:acetyl-CoA carboxylase carboxyl transferase subunit alpha|nr:acetyl-CoA carboxylase carboxyltransferase subunit alpha [Gemmatimonadota bacterium]MCL7963370.1 acetyl-CoA carboxylase carboxyltransferase subunit alpha [Candidatus Carthagonibacter metallireducens]MCL7937687.1 acetyl-CoA carboxylase carboxyltransferase subunit alpha [Gemmatimonadota bacterium]MCL7958438.1 acetyl-CoA carboxylase carboxyltransferase subunit alpha [Gemmatimonadota bacterium]MCL7964445.1 acetyl-CoA carboxylase carboxyltransferase subunit alpha [Gemmatimonadota bacterium]